MSNVSKVKVATGVYDIEDTTSREKSNKAETTTADLKKEFSNLKDDISWPTYNLNNLEEGRYNSSSSGIHEADSRYFGLSDMISCLPNTVYTVSTTGISAYSIYVSFFDENKNFIDRIYKRNTTDYTFTTPLNTAYLHAYLYDSTAVEITGDSHIQVELGDTAHPYLPPTAAYDPMARNMIGDLTELSTDEKGTLVGAINEILEGTPAADQQQFELDLIHHGLASFEWEKTISTSWTARITPAKTVKIRIGFNDGYEVIYAATASYPVPNGETVTLTSGITSTLIVNTPSEVSLATMLENVYMLDCTDILGRDVTDLKSTIQQMGSGIPYSVKVALDTILQNV